MTCDYKSSTDMITVTLVYGLLTVALSGLWGCKNRAHSISCPEVVKGI